MAVWLSLSFEPRVIIQNSQVNLHCFRRHLAQVTDWRRSCKSGRTVRPARHPFVGEVKGSTLVVGPGRFTLTVSSATATRLIKFIHSNLQMSIYMYQK
jgi:hypothetical protein